MDRLKTKRILFIVAHEFEDIELWYPLLRLSEEGASCYILALKEGLHTRPALPDKFVTGRFGTTVPPLVHEQGRRFALATLDDPKVWEMDALVIPGGYSPDALRTNRKVLELVQHYANSGKVIAALCHGPQVLISAGLAKGKRMTGYVAIKDDLINAGAHYVDEPVVVDGRIVTSRVPDDLPEFCQAIIALLVR
ncbi:MAG: type 1 glutamine amidotransferase domain-containing protein [Candidatus Hadarchaeum sp.]|uniref:type 1 glutamine amidotransferase domain-containing protein n=1 Tax=Candidatus Hadarchaeum sp. TaxID=2883567 RepID=UPI003D0D7C2C